MNILFFDTETTDIPDWKVPSDSEHQPHLVELAAILVDDQTLEIKERLEVLIRPDGWSWDDSPESENEAFKMHGITMAQCLDEGIPENEALARFMGMYDMCDLRVAHNTTFDNRLIRCAQKRYFDPESERQMEIMRSWKEDKHLYYCTMREFSKRYGGKWPKLEEAYKKATGLDMEGGHRAMADTLACFAVYQHLNPAAEAMHKATG